MDMTRLFKSSKLVIASHNAGKVREIGALLAPFGVETISVADLDLPEPIEDGLTFIENAEIKALAAAKASGLPALADDSGLEVAALGGEPGIYSARWAGPTKDFALAMAAVNKKLGNTTNRAANFTCALTLAWPDGHMESFEGKVYGDVVWPLRGKNGFGYDPFFVASGHALTFGEMAATDKHAISHRAKAFRQLIDACFKSG